MIGGACDPFGVMPELDGIRVSESDRDTSTFVVSEVATYEGNVVCTCVVSTAEVVNGLTMVEGDVTSCEVGKATAFDTHVNVGGAMASHPERAKNSLYTNPGCSECW